MVMTKQKGEEPVIAGYKSTRVQVTKGKEYYWCACGKSKTQPFCDGSHAGTSFSPIKFIANEDKEVAFCTCKHSHTKPLCDGTHRSLQQPQE